MARSADVEGMLELTRALVAVATRSVETAAPTVTLPQYRALLVLQRHGPCNGGGLAEQLGTHASTATRICDRLAALGHVTREQRPDNRREVQIAVTASGRRVVAAVERHRARDLTAVLGAMDPAARERLALTLPDLLGAMAHVPGAGVLGAAH